MTANYNMVALIEKSVHLSLYIYFLPTNFSPSSSSRCLVNSCIPRNIIEYCREPTSNRTQHHRRRSLVHFILSLLFSYVGGRQTCTKLLISVTFQSPLMHLLYSVELLPSLDLYGQFSPHNYIVTTNYNRRYLLVIKSFNHHS